MCILCDDKVGAPQGFDPALDKLNTIDIGHVWKKDDYVMITCVAEKLS